MELYLVQIWFDENYVYNDDYRYDNDSITHVLR